MTATRKCAECGVTATAKRQGSVYVRVWVHKPGCPNGAPLANRVPADRIERPGC